MSFTNDPTTYIGLIRMRVFDEDESDVIFSDEKITSVYTTLERSNIKRTAAFFLETIATREALILKVIKNLNLQTDGAKLADSLVKQAKDLRTQADDEDDEIADVFDWAEHVNDVFGERELLIKEILRDGG